MDSNGSRRASRARTRSQSEVLAVMLVFGMVILGAVAVIGLGAQAIDGTSSQLSDDRAENTLSQLDSKAGLVALGEAERQRISLPSESGEEYRVEEGNGQMVVTVTNLTDSTDFELMNETLGAVIYERDDTRLAYQGGGVWRATEQGSGGMISPPEFHYRDGTLTLPAISVVGDSSLNGDTSIQRQSESQVFPLSGVSNRLNPLDNHRVEVTVQSEYYRGWGQYFVERTEGSVDYDHQNESVTVTLVTPVDVNEITAASASLSAGGEFNVSGTSALDCGGISGESDVFTSSYNSSTGQSYCEQFLDNGDPLDERLPGTDGDVIYGKDVDISDGVGGSNFYGDITSGQTVTIDDSSGAGQVDVFGNISYVDACLSSGTETDCDQRIIDPDGEERAISRIPLTASIDWFIDTSVEAIEEEAGGSSPSLTDGTTLTAGEYHYTNIDIADNAEIELDTSDGPVIISVEEDVLMRQNAKFNVTGGEHVELYVGGEGTSTDFEMDDDATVQAPNDNGTQFRTYGKSDFRALFGGGGSGNLATYTGVVYAPPGRVGAGRVILDGAQVFGGILTGETSIRGGSIHYDEALEGKRIVPEDARIIRVTYLHVSLSTVRVNG